MFDSLLDDMLQGGSVAYLNAMSQDVQLTSGTAESSGEKSWEKVCRVSVTRHVMFIWKCVLY